MSIYSTTPIPDREARSHIIAVYVNENGKLGVFCRKCAETLVIVGTVLDLRDINELAKDHRHKVKEDWRTHGARGEDPRSWSWVGR